MQIGETNVVRIQISITVKSPCGDVITPHKAIHNSNRKVNLVEWVISIAVIPRIVHSTLFWLAQGDAALWLQKMQPNVSVAEIHC